MAAYRQFIYWTYHRLGGGIRKVIPSCVVLAIRKEFPELSIFILDLSQLIYEVIYNICTIIFTVMSDLVIVAWEI